MEQIEEFRDLIEEELGEIWIIVQEEIREYFDIIDFANINNRKNYNKLIRPNDNFLKDPLNIPEIYSLLILIMEHNFNFFNNNSTTKGYNHHKHAYAIKNELLDELGPLIEGINDFKINIFSKLLVSQKDIKSKEKFIIHDFQKYNLEHYNSFVNVINGIAYHNEFFIILPNLLRCLFENLLYDIFLTALNKKHKEFFFLKSQYRARDFSQLIALLNILKDKDFKPYHKDSINQITIDVLKNIQDIGNLTVHQILQQIDKKTISELKEKINIILQSLLIFYKKIEKEKLEIKDTDTINKIENKLNSEKFKKRIKSKPKKWKVIILEKDIPINEDNILEFLLPDNYESNILQLKYNIEDKNWDTIIKDMGLKINPLIKKERHYGLAVFSLGYISTSFYLGYLLTNRTKVKYSHYHRDTQSWMLYDIHTVSDLPKLETIIPNEKDFKNKEIIFKISLSAKILDEQLDDLGLDLNNKFEIFVKRPTEIWLESEYQLFTLILKFRSLISIIINYDIEKIHLFYAGPTAGAIALGRQINPRMTPPIQLYEFDRNRKPNYEKSILIGG